MLRVLKVGGVIYLAIPDKNYTYDKNRKTSTIKHLISDYINGDDPNYLDKDLDEHYLDYFKNVTNHVDRIEDPIKLKERCDHAKATSLDVHFHVYEFDQIIELFVVARENFNFNYKILDIIKNELEVLIAKVSEFIFGLQAGLIPASVQKRPNGLIR